MDVQTTQDTVCSRRNLGNSMMFDGLDPVSENLSDKITFTWLVSEVARNLFSLWMYSVGVSQKALCWKVWQCRFAKSDAVKSVPTPPSRPHPANPPPDIRRRHFTRRIALRELQRGSARGHRLEPRQQFVGDEPGPLRVRMLVALAVIVKVVAVD